MSINTTLAKWDFLAFSMYKWVSKASVWTCKVTTESCNQIRWYDRVPADGLDLRDSVLRNPCLLRRRPRSLPLQDPASQGWTRGGWSSNFIITIHFRHDQVHGVENHGKRKLWLLFILAGWISSTLLSFTSFSLPRLAAYCDVVADIFFGTRQVGQIKWSLSCIHILHKKPDRREIDLPGPPM